MMKSRSQLTSRKNPTKVSKKKLFLPMVSQMKKENLMGQGIALTLDDHFQEFYNLGERVDEGHAFGTINNLDDIHVYFIGGCNVDIYLLGKTKNQDWIGIRTGVTWT